jgi:hypothetical protein
MADERLGLRAVTMQQPFAAAMAAGRGMYTRRGKPAAFAPSGEWVAIHCGQNDEHLKNAALMRDIRRVWPGCPPDEALRAGQRSILGVARFVDGACDAKAAAAGDVFLARYDCSKPTAWRADSARACATPLSYPKGNLQLWHLLKGGFARPAEGALLLGLARAAAGAASGAAGAAGAPPAAAHGDGGSRASSAAGGKRPAAAARREAAAAKGAAACEGGGKAAKRARRCEETA